MKTATLQALLILAPCFCTSLLAVQKDAGPRWQISTTEDWQAFIADADGVKIADNNAAAKKSAGIFHQPIEDIFQSRPACRMLSSRQSLEWMNWQSL